MTFLLSVRLVYRDAAGLMRGQVGEGQRVADGLMTLEAASRREEAVVEWHAFHSIDDPRRFFLYELYRDAAGLMRTARPSTSPATSARSGR